jgi:hypothetical protein
VGFLDKAKAQATQLAAKAQEGVKQGQAKLGDAHAGKNLDGLLSELGAWVWAERNGRDEGRGAAEIERITGELANHEAEHGPAPSPAVVATPPPPPGGAASAVTPPPPPGAASAVTPPPPPGEASS